MPDMNQETKSKSIGFIGVGLMGSGMVERLMAAGNELHVLTHRNRGFIDKVCKKGAKSYLTVGEIISKSNFIFLCLPSSVEVLQIAEEIANQTPKLDLIIDCTTNSPDKVIQISNIFSNVGIDYVEAPLTGGVSQAIDGHLGALLGGSIKAIEKARPILEACCSQIAHFGPIGMGANTKLISNFLALGTATLVVETFHMARKMGIDWQSFYDLAYQGSGRSMSLERIAPKAIEGNYEGYMFSIANSAKDFRYIHEMFKNHDAKISDLAAWMLAQYEDAEAKGLGDAYLSQRLDPKLLER